jgi:hypothetical protein
MNDDNQISDVNSSPEGEENIVPTETEEGISGD